jgi:hypothetical protein
VPVTELEVKQQLVLEIGDVDPQTGDPPGVGQAGIVASRIDYLWERFAAWDQVGAGLRELHCRQAGIRLVLGVLAPRRFDSSDTRAGLSVRAHQLVDSYQQMLEEVTAEIALRKKGASLGGGGQSAYRGARLVTAAPLEASYPPDPNALRYGGTVNDLEPDGSQACPTDEVT